MDTNAQKGRTGFVIVSAMVLLFAWWIAYVAASLVDSASLGLAFEEGPEESVLIAMGAKVDPLVSQGEVHRLALSVFLHSGLEHLIINSLWLATLAWVCVRMEFSGVTFAMSFLAGALCGQTASFMVEMGPSVGGSGGIYALLGLLFTKAWSLHLERFQRSMLVVVALLFLVTPILWNRVDHAAHGAGFTFGITFGYLMKTFGAGRLKKGLAWAGIVTVFALLTFGPASSASELTLPSLKASDSPFDLNACEGLEANGPVQCVWEPGVVFASSITLQEFEELGAPGPQTVPRGTRCHTLTVQDQTMAMRRVGSDHLILVAVDAHLWPRFKASIRLFIGDQCPGT